MPWNKPRPVGAAAAAGHVASIGSRFAVRQKKSGRPVQGELRSLAVEGPIGLTASIQGPSCRPNTVMTFCVPPPARPLR